MTNDDAPEGFKPSGSGDPTAPQFPRPGFLNIGGYGGTHSQAVEVIGETPKRLRIRAIERTKLAGRSRWINAGETALVPPYAVTDKPLKRD